LREAPVAEQDVIHSPILHAKIEESSVTRPLAKIPRCWLRLTKNHEVRGVAALVPVNRFRCANVAGLAFIAE
jgi:hypothetical protein